MIRKLAAVFAAAALALGLSLFIAPAATADAGPNYVLNSSTSWLTAGHASSCPGDHCLRVYWDPSTDYWKVGVNTQCQSALSSEKVDFSIYKDATQGSWQDYDVLDSNSAIPDPVTETNFPNGAGAPGFHTPDFTGPFTFFAFTRDGDFITGPGGSQCQFQLLFYNHI